MEAGRQFQHVHLLGRHGSKVCSNCRLNFPSDGSESKCVFRCGGKGPEKPILCPNGDEVDWALSVSQEFNGCQSEPDPVAAH